MKSYIFGSLMKVTPRLFSAVANIDSLLAAAAAFILIQVYSRHSGIGVSPDSVTYLSSARHLVSGLGFISFDNLPTVDFPVAYPMLLSVISFLTKADPLVFASYLNGILFAIMIYLAGSIMNGFSNFSGWYKRILLLCFLLTPALQEVYSMIWSETIFLILILLFIWSVTKYLKSSGTKWIVISATVCAFICVTRYAGLFVLPAALALILLNNAQEWKKKIAHSILFGMIAVSLLSINVLRNYRETGLATGPRPRNHLPFIKILDDFGGVFSDSLMAVRLPVADVLIALMVVLVFLVSFIFQSRKNVKGIEYLIALTGLSYCAFMLISSGLTRYESFSNRLLSPLFILLPWSASAWIPAFLYRKSWLQNAMLMPIILIAASWFLTIQLAADYEFYDGVRDAGIPGYQEDPFVRSATVQYIKSNARLFPGNALVYSNAADAFYFVTGHAARQLPFTDFPAKVNQYFQMKSMPEFLVWFSTEQNAQMPTLDVVLSNKRLVLLRQLSDGAVYISK